MEQADGQARRRLLVVDDEHVERLLVERAVRPLGFDSEAWKIIRATVTLAHELGMSVVAEGIETASVALRVLENGCDFGQGWYFARALPASRLEFWLAERAETESAPS